jgi:phosphopantothenoylcysteine decarboxylase / phosphopantothenate---cysteine ligase
MGFEIAEACAEQGAKVILISGPVNLVPRHPQISLFKVQTAKQMFDICSKHFSKSNIAIFSAAVADFTPETTFKEKMKRGKAKWQINLLPTYDIAEKLGNQKAENQIIVGFALETENELENAKAKLHKKNLDFIVLNSLKDEGAGFGANTNRITILDKSNNIDKFELKSKKDVAIDIVEKIVGMLK